MKGKVDVTYKNMVYTIDESDLKMYLRDGWELVESEQATEPVPKEKSKDTSTK